MKRSWLKSTTAVVLVIGLATPHGVVAQSVENETSGIQLQGSGQGNASGAAGQALGAGGEGNQQGQQGVGQGQNAVEQLRNQLGGNAEADAQAGAETGGAAQEVQQQADQVQEPVQETAEDAQNSVQQQAEQAQDAAQEQAEQAQDNAQQPAEGAQETVQERTEEAQEAVEERVEEVQENSGQAQQNVQEQAGQVPETAEDRAAQGREQLEQLRNQLTGEAGGEVDEEAVEEAAEKAQRDNVEQMSAEEQAQQAAQTAGDTGAAALSGVGELLDRTQETVTEEQARSSNEEFDTDVTGRARANARAAAQADDDDNLGEILGAAAVGAIGAYMVGQSFQGGGQVVSNTGDRLVVEDGGQYRVIRDDNALLRRPGSNVETETYNDGSTRTIIDHDDGSRVVTVRSNNGAILQRTLIRPDGQEIVLIDETRDYQQVDVTRLQQQQAQSIDYNPSQTDELRAALAAQSGNLDRAYSLNQIRNINVVRNQVPVISLESVNFATNSAVIQPAEAEALQALGEAMRQAIEENPQQLFLVEGHTDTVGRAAYNLALSDRRAESVALALTEYFNVPASNLIVQGYGESDLKVQQQGDIRENRRAAVRNITPLLNGG